MPIIRNPFRKSATDIYTDETLPPPSTAQDGSSKTEVYSSATKPLNIRANGQEKQPTEYKMSEINDSGVFMPPSPPDTKSSFWSTRSATSTRSSSHRSVLNENEPFNISRESFDSYRRSFDISARSPVLEASQSYGRQSLDARQLRLPLSAQSPASSPKFAQTSSPMKTEEDENRQGQARRRPSATPYQPNILPPLRDDHINPPASEPYESEDALPPPVAEGKDGLTAERFEEVRLGDDPATARRIQQRQQQYHPSAKKPSIFSRFTGTAASAESSQPPVDNGNRPGSSGLGIGLGGHGFFTRKRGGSGQGAELGSIQGKVQGQPPAPEVKPES